MAFKMKRGAKPSFKSLGSSPAQQYAPRENINKEEAYAARAGGSTESSPLEAKWLRPILSWFKGTGKKVAKTGANKGGFRKWKDPSKGDMERITYTGKSGETIELSGKPGNYTLNTTQTQRHGIQNSEALLKEANKASTPPDWPFGKKIKTNDPAKRVNEPQRGARNSDGTRR